MKSMGLPAFRFSISWSRLLHADGSTNQGGLDFYNGLINALIAANIRPIVTLYHWDLPLAYSEQAGQHGWLNSSYIVPLFTHYADVVFESFGDRVKDFITFNEPLSFCMLGYENGIHAPGRCSDRTRCSAGNSTTEPYLCVHSVNLAHVHATKLYRDKYFPTQNGKIAITLNCGWAEPATESVNDRQAAERAMIFDAGIWSDVIYGNGDYSQEVRHSAGDLLPHFTTNERTMFQQYRPDFFGLNFYTSAYAYYAGPPATPGQGFDIDRHSNTSSYAPNGTLIGKVADSPWLFSTPWGLRKMVVWLAKRYPGFPIWVTENGMDVVKENDKPLADALKDADRVQFFSDYLTELGNAIDLGAPVKAYFLWSLLDNFEWADGYSKRFGIHYVDYKNNQTRYAKDSSKWFASFIHNVTTGSSSADHVYSD